ncbi:MAG TPA: DUF559 domain-containing protein, partial [Mycobacterium sp.]
RGEWRRLHRSVYLVSGFRRGDEARLRAAALWAGPAGLVSGASAAWWHGMLDDLPETVTILLPPDARRSTPDGIAVRRRDLLWADTAVRLDVPMVASPLAALDTAAELGDRGPEFLDRALQRHVRFPALYRAYCRNLGSAGSGPAGRLIIAAADRAGSAAERLLIRLLREGVVRGWVIGYESEGFVIDVAFPGARVAVEVDGWAWHVDVERFNADRRRQNRLVAAWWTVLRYTWHDLTQRPAEVIAEIRAEVGKARAA